MCTSDNRLFFNTATSHTFCSELRSCNLSYNWDNFELYALFSFWQREWVIVFHWNLLLVLTCKHWDLSYSAINLRSWGCWPILRFSMWHAGTRGMEFAWFLTFCEGRTTSETSVITYSVRYIALDRLLLPYLEPWAHAHGISSPFQPFEVHVLLKNWHRWSLRWTGIQTLQRDLLCPRGAYSIQYVVQTQSW